MVTGSSHDDHTDGNALAGPLAELFAVDVTAATTTCGGCGRQERVAHLHLYTGGPGMVARCPRCEHVIVRYARTATAGHLDLRGTVTLTLALPDLP
jgi:hypothetical protein